MYKQTDEIFVRINRTGFIPYINMCGPIPNPIKISTAMCLKLVTAGVDVHQFDPKTKQTIKLTRENVFDDQKFSTKKEHKPVQTAKAQVINPSAPISFTGVEVSKNDKAKTVDATEEVKTVEETVEEEKVIEEVPTPTVVTENVEEVKETVENDEVVKDDNTEEVKTVEETPTATNTYSYNNKKKNKR